MRKGMAGKFVFLVEKFCQVFGDADRTGRRIEAKQTERNVVGASQSVFPENSSALPKSRAREVIKGKESRGWTI